MSAVLRTEPLGDGFDLLAAYAPGGVIFERHGLGVAGWGGEWNWSADLQRLPGGDTAHMLETSLGTLDRSDADPEAPPPFVVGSIPFERGRAPVFIAPTHQVRRGADGRTWGLHVDGAVAGWPGRPIGRGPSAPFPAMQLAERPLPDAYAEAVAKAVSRIQGGGLDKVVLARSLEVAAGRRIDPARLLARLRAVDPDCYAFAVPSSLSRPRVLVGASPELLVSRFGREVRANPLAGSAPRDGDPDVDRASAERLAASSKDRSEHRFVVEEVARVLEPFCDELAWDPEPVLLETANVWHLSTRFTGALRASSRATALDLALALHPTPAVGGSPREAALRAIGDLERLPTPRGAYAGPVGWVDADGDGEWAIALRCALLDGDRATLYAGAGIVADSVPDAEVDETDRKFRAFLDALRWG